MSTSGVSRCRLNSCGWCIVRDRGIRHLLRPGLSKRLSLSPFNGPQKSHHGISGAGRRRSRRNRRRRRRR